ncbi:MAG: hypothetical protein ABJD11_02150 [Gemmatimonadota bacterium]
MHSRRIPLAAFAALSAADLTGAILLAPVQLAGRTLLKGSRIDGPLAALLAMAARRGEIAFPLRIAWPEAGDLHEDQAASRLAEAVGGPGLSFRAPRQSRVDLLARWNGVLRVDVAALSSLNRIDPLEVFTLFHGQAVRAGEVVASAKVAPHLLPERLVIEGEAVARAAHPIVDVLPYLPLDVVAIAAEPLESPGLARFDAAARAKTTALGGRFQETIHIAEEENERATAELRDTLTRVVERGVRLLLIGGVSAGDPLAPFYAALDAAGGRVLRHGVPAHPGSMIWLAELHGATLLGLPQCGMFSMATAADLVLPRLFIGEPVTADSLADLGHGGLLGPEMRFRFPAYARDLATPDA